ncbi:MAG: nucleoside phosphorylase [Anaerolineaceae bacterium]|nr:nucleoside phosphorylase [Anaerolineaceae bacterium]
MIEIPLFHDENFLDCQESDIGRFVFLPGDPGRVPIIAEYLDEAVEVARNREFLTFTGSLLGEKVSVTSTGIGCPSTGIAVQELINRGAEVLIRVGTSGMMQPHMQTGDLVITWGAIRDEFTSQQYIPLSFPAVADLDVSMALEASAKKLGIHSYTGISHTKDSFFGQHEPKRMPVKDKLLRRWKAWQQGGALCSEMEASTLLVLSSISKIKAGALMVVGSSQQDLENLILTAIGAVKILIQQEDERAI